MKVRSPPWSDPPASFRRLASASSETALPGDQRLLPNPDPKRFPRHKVGVTETKPAGALWRCNLDRGGRQGIAAKPQARDPLAPRPKS